MPSNKELAPQTLDYQEDGTRKQNQQLGARILSQVHFESSHKPIVESSFDKALKKGEKLPGKNDERRNLSYLKRLDALITKHGNKMEQRLWQASISDDLLVQYENIPESYWDAKRQELRDNGYGNIELTEEYKHELYKKELELQKESLEKWANYLGDEHSPYPLWFKIYAWDGITKIGRYNKGKMKYETRNETTVAPYPDPDAEILAGVFDVINRYYGNGEKQFYTEEGERNIKLEQIVQSGSFPKIFNAIQQDIAPIVEPPEKTEDVHGEWVEYQLGDEDDIARAAKGTGWCVASSSVGRYYLSHGTYGNDHNSDNAEQTKAKFVLLHLKDPSTGKLSRNAVASIRLDLDGNVAEISGLRNGQALDDSLVPIVEEKVKSLPGGEEFLPKFTDKQELIRLDRKMQNNEDLTKEELEFIYELKRPIETLDTYNSYDPRIDELRKYGINYALDAGINIDDLVSKLSPNYITSNLDTLISQGANINNLVSKLEPHYIVTNLDTLISQGANFNNLVSKMPPDYIFFNLDAIISRGANINIDDLVSEISPAYVICKLDALISHGANINIDDLVSKLSPNEITRNLDTLISHGANINDLVSKMQPEYVFDNLDILISHGAKIDIDDLVSKIPPNFVARNLDTFINHGANISIDDLVSKLSPDDIARNLDTLISHGANINIDDLVSKLRPYSIVLNLDTLISHGAKIDIDDLVSRLRPYSIALNLDTLISHGANIDPSEYR